VIHVLRRGSRIILAAAAVTLAGAAGLVMAAQAPAPTPTPTPTPRAMPTPTPTPTPTPNVGGHDEGERGRGSLPPATITALVAALSDTDAEVRSQVLSLLARLDVPIPAAALTAATHDKNEDVREQAIQVLTHSKDASATATLVEMLRDENADVRAQAASALGERRATAAIDPLVLMLKNDHDADARAQAAEALGSLGDERAVDALTAALKDLGVRRLRLMSYWNEHEKVQGKYDFTELDWQIDMAEKYDAAVTLCIGLRQPRWPESHWPAWAKRMPKEEWNGALYKYITAVVERYKDRKCIVSYQLENEALLKTFGADGDFDRKRLKYEFRLVKKLDPIRPVIMTTSNSWGIPFFGPRPDAYAFSLYRYVYHHGSHHHSSRKPWFYRLRAWAIMLLKWRVCFIHELQAEPWGPGLELRLTIGILDPDPALAGKVDASIRGHARWGDGRGLSGGHPDQDGDAPEHSLLDHSIPPRLFLSKAPPTVPPALPAACAIARPSAV